MPGSNTKSGNTTLVPDKGNDGNDSEAELDTRALFLNQQKKNRKSGGFQSMGLGPVAFKGIMKMGYKLPTPIQRKCIPVILEGKDVVAMARTGSGKTAAFLVPMIEKLKIRMPSGGARALIMSPTRELALQTLKFVKKLAKYSTLKAIPVFGGDRMEDQFSLMHENPDIIIATPGRFLHIVMEMNLKLLSVEYVVFDEADRLFEMGFQEQLHEILKRLPDSRQTLLFSATLPKILVDFSSAGFNDPVLIRLDVESQLSENLKLAFLTCRLEDKMAALLHLLRNVVKQGEMTIVFMATRHDIDYVCLILQKACVDFTFIYSSLDQSARMESVRRFREKQVTLMLVTDLAARGIDIPLLDNVINLNFPGKGKLFVHRVGRVARAGRSGIAYSLVAPNEMPYLLDLHLFLGRPMRYINSDLKDADWNGLIGSVPQTVIDEQQDQLKMWHKSSVDLVNAKKVCDNGYSHYLKSMASPSIESIRRVKMDMRTLNLQCHPLFDTSQGDSSVQIKAFLDNVKSYKPTATIFEIDASSKNVGSIIMKDVRQHHSRSIMLFRSKLKEKQEERRDCPPDCSLDAANEDDIAKAFTVLTVLPRKRKSGEQRCTNVKKVKKTDFRDPEYYLPHRPRDYHSEKGCGIGTDKPSFYQEVHEAVLDFTADDRDEIHKKKKWIKWDQRKKKYINEAGSDKRPKKIKTESGVWIPASYKSNLYEEWQKKSRITGQDNSDSENENSRRKNSDLFRRKKFSRGKKQQQQQQHGPDSSKKELKNIDQIYKARKIREKNFALQKGKKGRKGQKSGYRGSGEKGDKFAGPGGNKFEGRGQKPSGPHGGKRGGGRGGKPSGPHGGKGGGGHEGKRDGGRQKRGRHGGKHGGKKR